MPNLLPDTKEAWKSSLSERLGASMRVLQGQEPVADKHKVYSRCFMNVLRTDRHLQEEVVKLSPFEFELACISFTKNQIERGVQFFAAKDVSDFLAFRIDEKNRRKIQEFACIASSTYNYKASFLKSSGKLIDATKTGYCDAKIVIDDARVQDIFQRIQHMISIDAARELHHSTCITRQKPKQHR